MYNWDRGIDYQKTYRKMVSDLKKLRGLTGYKNRIRKMYTIILLIQLRNGSRVGEAIDYLYSLTQKFVKKGDVKVEKRKDGYLRKMVTPNEIQKSDVLDIKHLFLEKYGNKRRFVIYTTEYARRRYGWNSHSLRYAFITYLAKKGYSPQIIAKITGHRTLDYILGYTQKIKAEELLENI